MRIVGSRSGRLLGSTLLAGGVIPTSWLGTLVDLDSLISFGLAYHVISWLLHARDQVRFLRAAAEHAAARRTARRVTAVHLVPCLLGLAAALWPGTGPSALYLAISSPAVFFFFSLLHVIHTAWLRGLAPAGRTERAPEPSFSAA